MHALIIGILWGLIFVVSEAFQFVYFGNVFQSINSFLFGFLVFGIIIVFFVGYSAVNAPEQLKAALKNPSALIGLNISAALAWASYLNSVELIEPAVVYTISAGVMPLTAYIANHFSQSDEQYRHSRGEIFAMLILLLAIVYLAVVTISGESGFVRGDTVAAFTGVILAVADGVFFTWMLVFCKKLDLSGVGPGAVFGLRFITYVVIAGALSFSGVDAKPALPAADLGVIVMLGLLLTVPHLFALQKAVTKLSTIQLSALTTLGPFLIFLLQIIEARVAYSAATLLGLFIYFSGSLLSVYSMLSQTKTPRI